MPITQAHYSVLLAITPTQLYTNNLGSLLTELLAVTPIQLNTNNLCSLLYAIGHNSHTIEHQ